MQNRVHTQKKNFQEKTSVFSNHPVLGMFDSTPLMVQSKNDNQIQQTDLKTSLIQAEKYGHHLSKKNLANQSVSTAVQPKLDNQPVQLAGKKRPASSSARGNPSKKSKSNIADKVEKTPWWKSPDPGSNYVTDKLGRTTLAVHRIDGVHSGRKKKSLRGMKIPGMRPGDHKGHFGAEVLVSDPDRVNTRYNIAGESRDSNLSTKKKFENLAGRIKKENPDSKIYTVHEPLYRGQESRPVATTHSIMNDKGEILHSETILNKQKSEMHVPPAIPSPK